MRIVSLEPFSLSFQLESSIQSFRVAIMNELSAEKMEAIKEIVFVPIFAIIIRNQIRIAANFNFTRVWTLTYVLHSPGQIGQNIEIALNLVALLILCLSLQIIENWLKAVTERRHFYDLKLAWTRFPQMNIEHLNEDAGRNKTVNDFCYETLNAWLFVSSTFPICTYLKPFTHWM